MENLEALGAFIVVYGALSYLLGIYVGYQLHKLTVPKEVPVRVTAKDLRPRD